MVVHWPKGISNTGGFSRETCHLVDLLPTWMAVAGPKATYPGLSKQTDIPPLDGVSILPTFNDKTLTRTQPFGFQYGAGKALRDGDWKLVNHSKNRTVWELYNIANNRSETRDLASSEPKRAAAMKKGWLQWFRDTTGADYKEPVKKNKKQTTK